MYVDLTATANVAVYRQAACVTQHASVDAHRARKKEIS
jgi:hypothetical protein